MTAQIKVLHYINQFFGGIGGEEKANVPVEMREGATGPGRALQGALGEHGTIVATAICGDNFFVEETDSASASIREALDKWKPDVVVTGPAFDAGRYGMACGLMARLAAEKNIPSVTAMHPDNSGVVVYGKDMITIPTGVDVTEMQAIMAKLAAFAVRLGSGEILGPAEEEGYLPRGIRRLIQRKKTGAVRAVEMMTDYILGRPFTPEIPLAMYETIPPAPPIADLESARIAMVSSGGIVPRDNPDNQVSSRAEQYFKYPIKGLDELTIREWRSVHGGFNTYYLNEKDPNYALPVRYARALEKPGLFKELYHTAFTTVGTGCAVTAAKRMGEGIVSELKEADVDGVLLVAT
jgi:betaine reductase